MKELSNYWSVFLEGLGATVEGHSAPLLCVRCCLLLPLTTDARLTFTAFCSVL